MPLATSTQASVNAEIAAALTGDMDTVYEEQVNRAGAKYRLDAGFVTGTRTDIDTQPAQDARVNLADDTHTTVLNQNLGGVAKEPYAAGNVQSLGPSNTLSHSAKIQVNVDASNIDGNPPAIGTRGVGMVDTQGVEDLSQEAVVKALAASGDLYNKAGPIGNWTGSMNDLSLGVDGAFLAERSKQTGTKFF